MPPPHLRSSSRRGRWAALLVLLLPAAVTAKKGLDEASHASNLIDWLRASGGHFDERLELRRVDPSDPTSRFGMFATSLIDKDDLLLRIPRACVLDSGETKPEISALVCGTAHNLAQQLALKSQSPYAPYVNYLLETQPPGQLPSAWTPAAQELLVRLLGHAQFDYSKAQQVYEKTHELLLKNTLPPGDPIGWVEHEWAMDCNSGEKGSELEQYAALLVVQRAWDDLLIPVYDMMSHRNGQYLNTASKDGVGLGGKGTKDILVTASQTIHEGDELYTSYNQCEDCGARKYNYGTPEILRDYGFIEDLPQTWVFSKYNLAFRLDSSTTNTTKEQVVLTEWIHDEKPDEDGYEQLVSLLEFVETQSQMVSDDKRNNYPTIQDYEWTTMQSYMFHMARALQTAIHWYDAIKSPNPQVCEEGDDACQAASLSRYANLQNDYETHLDTGYHSVTCDTRKQFRVFDDGTYITVDSFKSHYQTINFMKHSSQSDMCMDLDDKIQICASYRPHYHEYAVHQVARFLPPSSIQRVLFVGGGDSMLLHEILKYPTLEKVVGLEIDQKVTRGCFHHFGTSPHFEDDRVEWWFGDASKSLLMLPKDYFGSFDLVLVDLSETVTSFKVIKKLDVLEALTLLVKPEGIFVKNEVYFDKFKTMFPYVAQINWYDNPIICSQVMVMGSRMIDFLHPTLTDQGTANLEVRALDSIQDHFDMYHDYAYNNSGYHLCDTDTATNDFSHQQKSPGIIFVVEAEDAAVDKISKADVLKETLSKALAEKGFTVVGSEAFSEGDNSIVSVVLTDGYVLARAMAKHKYCGFDIHFWSSFDKHEVAKDALVAAVGSKAPALTSYRVIAGGMFGAPTWQDDVRKYGPQFDDLCQTIRETTADDGVKLTDGKVPPADVDAALEHGLGLIGHGNLKVAMLVGSSDESKSTVEKNKASLEQFESVDEVMTLNCPTMANFKEFSPDAGDSLVSCEKHLLESVKGAFGEQNISAIVIDETADQFTATVLLKVFSARKKSLLITNPVLEEDAILLSASFDEKADAWRRNLLLLFKDDVFEEEPTAFADVLFYNEENKSGFNLLVTNHEGEFFFSNLNRTVTEIENDSSATMKAQVQVVHGGEWIYQENFKASHLFGPEDYDQSEPLEQWESQKPLGHQFILQMEPNPNAKDETKLSNDIVKKAMENALSKSNLPGLDKIIIKEYNNLGDGGVLVCLWSGGSAVVLWDGRNHVDVNLFTYVEEIKLGNAFESNFFKVLPLSTMLRDEQPRGIGRVVSYRRDLVPYWAQ